MTTFFELRLEWIDERLTWNPKEYENTDIIVIKKESIFTPDLIVTNSPDINTSKLKNDFYLKVSFREIKSSTNHS